jgi:hypothetical protein
MKGSTAQLFEQSKANNEGGQTVVRLLNIQCVVEYGQHGNMS